MTQLETKSRRRPAASRATTASFRRRGAHPSASSPSHPEGPPPGASVLGAIGVRNAMETMRATQGRARQFWQVFETSRVPMTLVDNDRWHVAANPPARLLFRLTLAELVARRIDDITPPQLHPTMHDHWARLMANGVAAAPYHVGLPDGSELSIVYCALANVLPGRHLIVFAPAGWPGDELVSSPESTGGAPMRGLSRREREVLSLIATGADRQEIADELTISVATVRTHVRNLLRKLNARNRAHAIALAMQHGLIELPAPGEPPA